MVIFEKNITLKGKKHLKIIAEKKYTIMTIFIEKKITLERNKYLEIIAEKNTQ